MNYNVIAGQRLDPNGDLAKREVRLLCTALHMLNSALNEEGQTAVGSLQAIITVLRENGSADLRSLGAVACENESVDWAEVFSQLDDKANCMQTAYEATILSLAQVALCFACFEAEGPSDKLNIPSSAFALLRTLPLHCTSTVTASTSGDIPQMLADASLAIRWWTVLPTALLQRWAQILPSKKSKLAKQQPIAGVRTFRCIGLDGSHHALWQTSEAMLRSC